MRLVVVVSDCSVIPFLHLSGLDLGNSSDPSPEMAERSNNVLEWGQCFVLLSPNYFRVHSIAIRVFVCMYVCLFVCLYVCLRTYLKTRCPNFTKFLMHVSCGRGLVLVWRSTVMQCLGLQPLRVWGVPGRSMWCMIAMFGTCAGLQSLGGLVVVRRAHLWDGSRLSAVLRRRTDPDLREDRLWQGTVGVCFSSWCDTIWSVVRLNAEQRSWLNLPHWARKKNQWMRKLQTKPNIAKKKRYHVVVHKVSHGAIRQCEQHSFAWGLWSCWQQFQNTNSKLYIFQ